MADAYLGPELSFSLFYVLPIGVAAWYADQAWGVALAFLGGALWLLGQVMTGVADERLWTSVWNGGIRIGMFLVVVSLLLRLRGALERERVLASVDLLTGLANSRYFLDRLQEEIDRANRYGDPFTVAYIDLDDFKIVNDRGGHAEGDRLLQIVAEAMQSSSRRTDVLARLGGDEFGILLPQTSFDGASPPIRKLLDRIVEEMLNEGWPVSASAGVVSFEAEFPDAGTALRAADLLMYEVKDRRKGGVRHLRWLELQDQATPPPI